MKTRRLFQILSIGISALLLTACLSGTPNRSGNSAVNKNTPAVQAPSADNSTQSAANVPSSNVAPTNPSPVVNVYLETSGSMNGYVNGGTSIFQQVVKEYLSGINNAGFASAVNYFYVNNQITPRGNNLDQYITNLRPSSFASHGSGATTDIGAIFKSILGRMDNNTISVFISDCIISPGRGVDTEAYARGQMTDVRDAVVKYINDYGDLACMVYQFDSGFKGSYFDFENTRHAVDMQRPFYIWVFGHTFHLHNLKLVHVPDRDFRVAPIRNQWMVFNTPLSELQDNNKYGVLLPTGANNGKYSRKGGTVVSNILKFDDNYRFSFGANMQKAQLLMGDDFVEDTDNYVHVINKATKEKFYGVIEKDYAQQSPFTEIFRVDSPTPFQRGNFTLAFLPTIPKWALECTDLDDRSFNGSNDNKTYGLVNIFLGIFSGYNSGAHDNILAKFDFEIK